MTEITIVEQLEVERIDARGGRGLTPSTQPQETTTMTLTTLRGTSRRAAYLRALPHHWYRSEAAAASLRQLADGSWVATRTLPWAAVATIPMPVRPARHDHRDRVPWAGDAARRLTPST